MCRLRSTTVKCLDHMGRRLGRALGIGIGIGISIGIGSAPTPLRRLVIL